MTRCVALAALAAALVHAAIPPPQSHFGHPIGADRTVLDWDKVVSYFQALEKSSDRIRVRVLGKTVDGKPFIAATIAEPATLKSLDRYLEIQQKLADPRRTPAAEAEKLIFQGKVVVMITCSIHATEIASTHTAVEFAHRILTEDKPRFRTILNNVVFLLVPSLNPDGVDIVTRWYRKTVGTPYEGTSPPELYHRYVGHDNNRDWYIFSQPETRLTVSELHNIWHPQIVYDVHQQGPYASRMFVPPWLDPVDPNIDPVILQECNRIGSGMASDLTAAGKKGVVVNAMYDFWTPGRHYQAYHGGLRILSESASARLASPIRVEPDQITDRALGYNPRERSWNYPEPWLGGDWRLRDIIDYQSIAWESLLYQAAVSRESMLRNFYHIGRRATDRQSPYAFVVPGRQRDPGSTRKMLETLAFGMVEVDRAATDFSAGGKTYPAGSYVIRMQQPYSSYAKTLLERQHYPDLRLYPDGPPKRPYDVTAHTLPLLMGVEVDLADTPFAARLERADKFAIRFAGPSEGDIERWRESNRGGTHPRIGLYKSWNPSMDEGWTRWILEQFGFKYQNVRNADVQAGKLGERFDVIVFPDQSASIIADGYRKGSMPEEYTGGLGTHGADALKQFLAAGGRLVFLNDSTSYATEQLGIGPKSVVRGVSNREFYSPGSLLNVRLDTKSPLARGLPANIAIWSEGSPAWEHGQGHAVATYPQTGVLASGWLLGEKYLAGRAALLDIPVGSGRVILFGMRPQYRAQSYQTFHLLFNALVYKQ
jgi:hypothetical protein